MAVPSLSNKIPGSKCCGRCLIEKPPSEFYKYRYVCKACTIARTVKYQKDNPEQKRSYQLTYYHKNSVEVLKKKRKYKEENREKYLASARRTSFLRRLRAMGATEADLANALAEQNGHCAICQIRPVHLNGTQYVHIDHCHKTGRFRGILCHTCNTGIGKFADDPERLVRAADYVRRTINGHPADTGSAGSGV